MRWMVGEGERFEMRRGTMTIYMLFTRTYMSS